MDTANTYVATMRPFWTWCRYKEIMPREASQEAVERFMAEQLAKVSRSTCHVRLSALKAFFGWLEVEPDPTRGLTVRKDQRQPRPPFSDVDESKLIENCQNEEERLLFVVGMSCGLRISEIVGLKTSDIYGDRELILIKGKGHKERWISPPPVVFEAIKVYMGRRQGRIFEMTREQARRIMNRIARNAEVSGFYPHRMRITFASRFLDQTHDLHSLQVLMGHSDPGVTANYAAFDAQKRALDQMKRIAG